MVRTRGTTKRARGYTRGSSSSSPPPATAQFLTPEHQQRYLSLLGRRIIQERQVEFASDPTNPIDSEIRRRQWQGICTFGPSQKTLTQEFYANAWQPDTEERPHIYTSEVRDKVVPFDASTLQRVLRTHFDPDTRLCPYQGLLGNLNLAADAQARLELHPEELFRQVLATIAIPGTRWDTCQSNPAVPQRIYYLDLLPVAKFWYKFSVYILLPSTHHHDVNVPRAILIHMIMSGQDIDVCTLLSHSLYDTAFARNQRAALGHSSLIQTLCLHAGVVLPPDTETLRENTTLRVAAFIPLPPPVEQEEEAERAGNPADFPPADADPPVRGGRRDRRVRITSQLRAQQRQLNLLMEGQVRLETFMMSIMRTIGAPVPDIGHVQPAPDLAAEEVSDSSGDSISEEF